MSQHFKWILFYVPVSWILFFFFLEMVWEVDRNLPTLPSTIGALNAQPLKGKVFAGRTTETLCFCLLEGMDQPTLLGLPNVFSWVGSRELPPARGSCRIPALAVPLGNTPHAGLLWEINLLKSGSKSFPRKIRILTLTTFSRGWIKHNSRDIHSVLEQNGSSRSRFKRRDVLWEVISCCLPRLYMLPWVSGHEAI